MEIENILKKSWNSLTLIANLARELTSFLFLIFSLKRDLTFVSYVMLRVGCYDLHYVFASIMENSVNCHGKVIYVMKYYQISVLYVSVA